jgi:hypothetical protein
MNATPTLPTRQRKPRAKPARSIRLCVKPDGKSPGVVNIRVGKEAADYFLTELPADFGRGFKVEKIGLDCRESAYAVNVDSERRSCECKGYLHHGHCRHVDGLAALIARNLL